MTELIGIAIIALSSDCISGQIDLITPTNGEVYPYQPGVRWGLLKFKWNYSGSSSYSFYGVKVFIDGADNGWVPNGGSVYVSDNFRVNFEGRVQLWEQRVSDNQVVLSQTIVFSFSMTTGVTVNASNSYSSGEVRFIGSPYFEGTYSSGTPVVVKQGETVTIEAFHQQYVGSYWRWFRRWVDANNPNVALASYPQLSYSTPIGNSRSFVAQFAKELNVRVESQNPSKFNVRFDNNWYTGGWTWTAYDDDPPHEIQLARTYEVIQDIEYIFTHWAKGSTVYSTATTSSIQPTVHSTITAVYNQKPLRPTNPDAGGAVGQNVLVTWTDNPRTDVTQYQIWRQLKTQSSTQVATVNRGVQSWIDPNYVIAGTSSDGLLQYYIYAVWSVTGALSDPAYAIAWAAQSGPRPRAFGPGPDNMKPLITQLPREYAVSNYPNPFNPSTTFAVQLVENAMVTLEIFDVLGRNVHTLLADQRSAGYHIVIWNGKDSEGRQLSSGMYLYRFLATPLSGKEAFLNSGKLVLLK